MYVNDLVILTKRSMQDKPGHHHPGTTPLGHSGHHPGTTPLGIILGLVLLVILGIILGLLLVILVSYIIAIIESADSMARMLHIRNTLHNKYLENGTCSRLLTFTIVFYE